MAEENTTEEETSEEAAPEQTAQTETAVEAAVEAGAEAAPATDETAGATDAESAEPAQEAGEAQAPSSRSSSNELSDNLVDQLPAVEGEAAPRKEVPGGRAYEIIYIVRTGDPGWVEKSIERVREIVEGGEGAVDNVRASETRRLAYPIEKQSEGVYVVTNARFASGVSGELERYFRIEESVLRYMILREED